MILPYKPCCSRSTKLTPLVEVLLERTDGRCWYCGKTIALDELTKEHKIPQSRGGLHALDNLVAACRSCNTRKRDKTPEEYRSYLHSRLPGARAADALRFVLESHPQAADLTLREALSLIESRTPKVRFFGERQR